MTSRVIEGFDFMPSGLSGTDRSRLWAAKGYYVTTGSDIAGVATGRFNFGNAMVMNAGAAAFSKYLIPTGVSVDEGFSGIAFYYGDTTSDDVVAFFSLYSALTSEACITIVLRPNGIVQVWRGSIETFASPVVLVQAGPGIFQENEWGYLEARCKVHDTSGIVEIRVNTKTVISLIAADTKPSSTSVIDSLQWGTRQVSGSNRAVNVAWDDLYFNDTAGSVNNGFLGNCRVMTQRVTGNASPQNFAIGGTLPAATAWQSVLNSNLDDGKFIYDGTVGDRSLFTLEAIINTPMVFAAQLSIAARMDDATQRILGNVMKSGATVMSGADHYINQGFTFYKDIQELNAATGVGFTGAELNALLVGPNVNA